MNISVVPLVFYGRHFDFMSSFSIVFEIPIMRVQFGPDEYLKAINFICIYYYSASEHVDVEKIKLS